MNKSSFMWKMFCECGYLYILSSRTVAPRAVNPFIVLCIHFVIINIIIACNCNVICRTSMKKSIKLIIILTCNGNARYEKEYYEMKH